MIAPAKKRTDSRRRERGNQRAFTLIELMAVALVIALLAGIMLSVAGYIQKRMAIQTTRCQIAAIEAALAMYKADWGYYPATCPCRISSSSFCEATNNWILYKSLSGINGGKKYMSFWPSQLRPNAGSTHSNFLLNATANSTNGGLMNVYDVWGEPFNYYNSPRTAFTIVSYSNPVSDTNGSVVYNTGYTLGGQVNLATYDLFSYGPDHFTYVPGALDDGSYSWFNPLWTNTAAALDDITNFGK